MKCVASIRNGEPCGNDCEVGYKFCEEHKGRKKAVEERLEKTVSGLSNPQNNRMNFEDPHEAEIVEEQQETALATRNVAPVVNNTSHRTIVDQVNDMLTRVVDWEFSTFNEMNKLEPNEWRYRDKAGAEQIRGEVAIYERAQDRSLRALTQITKLGIEQQAAIVEKAQYEGVRTAIQRTLVRMGFDQQQISEALRILAEEFSNLVR